MSYSKLIRTWQVSLYALNIADKYDDDAVVGSEALKSFDELGERLTDLLADTPLKEIDKVLVPD